MVGSNVAKFRKEKGWTQVKLAEAVGVSCGYIALIEQGKKRPALKTLAIIAEKLGVELQDIKEGNK